MNTLLIGNIVANVERKKLKMVPEMVNAPPNVTPLLIDVTEIEIERDAPLVLDLTRGGTIEKIETVSVVMIEAVIEIATMSVVVIETDAIVTEETEVTEVIEVTEGVIVIAIVALNAHHAVTMTIKTEDVENALRGHRDAIVAALVIAILP